MRLAAKSLGYVAGGLAVAVAAVCMVPVVVLWLAAAFLLDVADGGLVISAE